MLLRLLDDNNNNNTVVVSTHYYAYTVMLILSKLPVYRFRMCVLVLHRPVAVNQMTMQKTTKRQKSITVCALLSLGQLRERLMAYFTKMAHIVQLKLKFEQKQMFRVVKADWQLPDQSKKKKSQIFYVSENSNENAPFETFKPHLLIANNFKGDGFYRCYIKSTFGEFVWNFFVM